ncbi:MAG: M48 family metalloprotease [Saprospiraceae bacterium]|nr:M48 family metalloprotease [Saprospiraceae bacterium]
MTTPFPYSILAQSFGLAVLHSLWQIALIWVFFRGATTLFQKRHQWVYLASLVAMGMSAVWFLYTLFEGFSRISEASAATITNAPMELLTPTTTIPETAPFVQQTSWMEASAAWLANHSQQIGWVWGICVALLWLRLLGGWWLTQRLRRMHVTLPEPTFTETCRRLRNKLKINSLVTLLESPHVREPLTLGFWKPLILFPAGMLMQLTPAQVEALLLHELAHIRRFDYLVNLIQLALETCFFYHPLFWLISREARVRREFCCDDVVLRHTNDPMLYARTLTNLQISIVHLSTQFTMNATGKNRFTERIMRIAGINPRRENKPSLFLIMMLPLGLALCSWWPTQAEEPILFPTETYVQPAADTLPPAKSAQPGKAAKPKELAQPATSGDDETPGVKAAIEAVRMNVFYIGVDNPVRVAVPGIQAKDLKVEIIAEGATISGSNGNYNVRVSTPGSALIRVSHVKNGKVELVSEQKYRVKRIPDPAIRMGENSGGKVTKEHLLSNNKVLAMLQNFDFDAECKVIGYEVTVLPKGGDPTTYTARSSEIPTAAIESIQSLSGDGDAVFFDDIKVMCPGDMAPRNVGGMAYKLIR